MGLSNDLSCEAGSLSCCRPNSHGGFQSGLRLYFPELEPWVVWSASLPAVRLLYLCMNVGPQALSVVRLPAPFVPHSTSLGPATATRVLSALVSVSTPPTGLDECLFFISLVSDFLAVGFSVSSGCARRRSVSTYAPILVLLPFILVGSSFSRVLFLLLCLLCGFNRSHHSIVSFN